MGSDDQLKARVEQRKSLAVMLSILVIIAILMCSQQAGTEKLTVSTRRAFLAQLPDEVGSVAQWLLAQGAVLHRCLSVRDCDKGRCVVTTCDLNVGDTLVDVPSEQLVDPYPSSASSPCPDLDTWLTEPEVAEWHLSTESLRLQLRLVVEQLRGETSPWAAYMRTIPSEFPPEMADESLARTCLAGTPASGFALDRHFQRVTAETRLLRRCIPGVTEALTNLGGEGTPSDAMFLWARHVVMSRAYAAVAERGKTSVLVPFADLFNDHPEPSAAWKHDPTTGHFRITATQKIASGEEVTISYGAKANDFLLLHYGFAHRENPLQTVDIALTDEHSLKGPPVRISLRGETDGTTRLPAQLRDLRAFSPPLSSLVQEEIWSLRVVAGRCGDAAMRWSDMSGRPEGMCREYVFSIASLAGACHQFALQALQHLPDSGVQEESFPHSTDIIAQGLTASLLQQWKTDVSRRLPEIFSVSS